MFVDPYPLLITADCAGFIMFWGTRGGDIHLVHQCLHVLKNHSAAPSVTAPTFMTESEAPLVAVSGLSLGTDAESGHLLLFVADEIGWVHSHDLTELVNTIGLEPVPEYVALCTGFRAVTTGDGRTFLRSCCVPPLPQAQEADQSNELQPARTCEAYRACSSKASQLCRVSPPHQLCEAPRIITHRHHRCWRRFGGWGTAPWLPNVVDGHTQGIHVHAQSWRVEHSRQWLQLWLWHRHTQGVHRHSEGVWLWRHAEGILAHHQAQCWRLDAWRWEVACTTAVAEWQCSRQHATTRCIKWRSGCGSEHVPERPHPRAVTCARA